MKPDFPIKRGLPYASVYQPVPCHHAHVSLSDQVSLPGLSKGRVESLTDGIFATVMTVLVLTLTVPVLTGTLPTAELNSDITAYLWNLLPDILGYVLSFLLLAVMWVSHHNVFHYVDKVNRPLIWLNVGFLLSIGFVPFSTALLGRYPLLQLPSIIYGANILAISVSMLALQEYLLRHKMMVAEKEGETVLRRIINLWRIGIGIYSTAILASFVNTEVSLAIYVGALGFYVLVSSAVVRP
jgi:uncharacterized membrane protein